MLVCVCLVGAKSYIYMCVLVCVGGRGEVLYICVCVCGRVKSYIYVLVCGRRPILKGVESSICARVCAFNNTSSGDSKV